MLRALVVLVVDAAALLLLRRCSRTSAWTGRGPLGAAIAAALNAVVWPLLAGSHCR